MPHLKPKILKALKRDQRLRLKVALACNASQRTIDRWIESNSMQLTQDKAITTLAVNLGVMPNDLVEYDPELQRLMSKEKV